MAKPKRTPPGQARKTTQTTMTPEPPADPPTQTWKCDRCGYTISLPLDEVPLAPPRCASNQGCKDAGCPEMHHLDI